MILYYETTYPTTLPLIVEGMEALAAGKSWRSMIHRAEKVIKASKICSSKKAEKSGLYSGRAEVWPATASLPLNVVRLERKESS